MFLYVIDADILTVCQQILSMLNDLIRGFFKPKSTQTKSKSDLIRLVYCFLIAMLNLLIIIRAASDLFVTVYGQLT